MSGYACVDVCMRVVGMFAGDPYLSNVIALFMRERAIKIEFRSEFVRNDIRNLPWCPRVHVGDVNDRECRYAASGVEYYLTGARIGIKPIERVLKY